jgi:carboxyl-terminal processing protease
MNVNKFKLYLPVLFSLILILGIYIGLNLQGDGKNAPVILKMPGAASENQSKINEIINYIKEEYVDSVNVKELEEKTIQYLLQELDPHSYYIPAKDLQSMNEPIEGEFEGIGIEFRIINDTVVVINPIGGGPSEKVGIMPGDRIVSVNDSIIAGTGITNRDIMQLLRGEKGTEVKVGIKRNGSDEILSFHIVRDKIPINSVEAAYMIDDETGYIKLSRFSRTSHEEFVKAAEQLLEQGMKKLIFDLTGNGGGLLEAAVDIADEFLPDKTLIVYTEGKARPKRSYYATSRGILEDIPVAVLIDEGSASASEIVAGAIQDNDRGIIIGRRSFGKGLVQEPSTWPDGSAIRLTIARYYTPTGRSIQRPYDKGVEKYHEDYYNRLNSGELITPDSVHFPDSLKYTTPKGKTVYGGGGIMPDIFVPIDTAHRSFYLSDLIYKGIIRQYAFDKIDKNRHQWMQKYPDIQSFKNKYVMTEQEMQEFIKYAENKGVKYNEKEFQQSMPLIKLYIKAFIARNLYGENGYYQIVNEQNPMVKKALEALNNIN